MKLTKRGEYALRTLIRLGIASRQGEGVISVSALADQERLPFKFLEAILFELKQAGYVESLRGKHGGARLAKQFYSRHTGTVRLNIRPPLKFSPSAPLRLCVTLLLFNFAFDSFPVPASRRIFNTETLRR